MYKMTTEFYAPTKHGFSRKSYQVEEEVGRDRRVLRELHRPSADAILQLARLRAQVSERFIRLQDCDHPARQELPSGCEVRVRAACVGSEIHRERETQR